MSENTRQRVNGPSQHEGANAQATVRNEVVTVVGTERGTVANSIPEDVMQKAEEAYLSSLHDSMAGKADYLKHVGLAILAERDGWEPIETAPKDGTDVLVALHLWNDPTKPHTFEVVAWDGEQWASDAYPVYPPTHWRPLPKPPVSSANTTEGDHHD